MKGIVGATSSDPLFVDWQKLDRNFFLYREGSSLFRFYFVQSFGKGQNIIFFPSPVAELKNLSGGLNLSRGLNMVGST